MRLTEKTDSHLLFELPRQELHLFQVILNTYPVKPSDPALSPPPHPPGAAPDPEILESALADLISYNKAQLHSFLARNTPTIPFSDTSIDPKTPSTLHIPLDEIDFLLQVLNEIRVGCWYRLGCPEQQPDSLPLEDSAANHWAMIMLFSGIFQEYLLEALDTP